MSPSAFFIVLRVLWNDIMSDRVVIAGGTTGGATLGVAHAASEAPIYNHMAAIQPYVVFFGALLGGLCSLATLVYVCIKIGRLVKNPSATG